MRGLRLITLAAIPALVLSACSSTAATPSAVTPSGSATPAPSAPVGMTVVRWFVGLGGGTNPNQIDAQKTFVKNYNASQSKIYINLEIVPNANAYDILKTQIAAGNAPDIIGPVGVRGRNGFAGVFLDLTPQITKYKFDTSRYPAAVLDFFKQGGEGQIGLPYLMFPAFMFYNKDIFAQQNLTDLPKKVGDQWNGKDWTWETVAGIAKSVTVDKNGKKSTDAGFDKNNIVQFGFDAQWWDGRRLASAFGSGTFAGDGNKAQIPDAWAYGWKWYYDAMWKYNFAPTGKYINSALLNTGTTVSSGRIALDAANPWFIGSLGKKGDTKIQKWDMGVLPSYNGKTSIMGEKTLQIVYGGIPVVIADQAAYYADFDKTLAEIFPGNKVSWEVLAEMQNYPAIPSHEVDMPNFLKVINLYNAFYTKLQSQAGLNVDTELTKLKADIQKAFDDAAASPKA
jgi:multiple sugar transport system substrate-binding protein